LRPDPAAATPTGDRGFIDVSASFGPDAGRSRGRPLSVLLAEQRSHGVRVSLAHSRVGVDYATERGNQDALAVAADPVNRVRAVAVLDASLSRGQDVQIARWAAAGAAGFWLESREAPIGFEGETGASRLRAIAATGRPVLVPVGSSTVNPSAISAIARATDGLGVPVILVGVHYSNAVEALEVAQRHDQIHVETSGMAHFGAVEFAVDRIGHERVLFGSGGPGRALQAPLNMALLADIPDDAKRAILAGNAARLFGLDPGAVDLTPPRLPRDAFDVHSHYMPWSAYDVPVVADEALLPTLSRWGTTMLASSSFNAFAADLIAGNRETVEQSRAGGGAGQGGLIVLDPADRDASADTLARWRDAPGIRGAKIHSFYSGVDSTDPRMAELFALAAGRDCPVKIHNNGPDWASAIASYARAHPRLRILLAHSGPGMPSIEAARLAAAHEHVYLELASSFANLPVMRELVAIAGAGKIAWGTDAPLLDPRFVLGSYMDAGVGPADAPDVYRAVPERIFGPSR
jgi:predicted TIM-barrel fold metal-dependent hydrolase